MQASPALRLMQILRAVLLLTAPLPVLVSCSSTLTPTSAKDAIRADLAMTSPDVAEVAAISNVGRNDAIVSATINGRQMRLRFRRYHDRWIWEAAESATGSWLAAPEVVKQVREATRQEKAMEWARSHRDGYTKTVQLIDHYTARLPRRMDSTFNDVGWVRELDAWGSEIIGSFQPLERTAVFVSPGPDRTAGTSDDLVVKVTGETTWDEGDKKPIYKYSNRWTVPEGLEGATRAVAGTNTIDVQPSRVVTDLMD